MVEARATKTSAYQNTIYEVCMENTSLSDELVGKTGIETDHGALGFGDLVVLLLDAVLLIYTGWRSYDFLTTTVPTGFQMLALIGLWGLDIGALAWSIVWIFGSSEKYQDWISMAFFVIDLTGVVLTSLTDSLMYGAKGGAMTGTLTGIATVLIPLVVVGNVIAGFIYHFTSPATKARRAKRKANAAHRERMREIEDMQRNIAYAEEYLLAKQDTLEKSLILAEIKTAQDAVEKATRAKLHDQLGIRNQASSAGTDAKAQDVLNQLRQRLTTLASAVQNDTAQTSNPDTPAETKIADGTAPDLGAALTQPFPTADAIVAEAGSNHNGHGKSDAAFPS